MVELSELNPDNDSNNNEDEIESPAEGPPPDWMKAATSAGESGFSEEKAPDWLKSIRAGKGSEPSKKDDTGDEDSPAAAEGLSDLERLLAEEGIDLGAVAEERPEGAENMSAKEWLIS
ncbi:MAG: hypothetical protein R3264_16175, partial [Anaerolineae bacterium]|nr:hypothetical protein [Anaerolineae bacterium]